MPDIAQSEVDQLGAFKMIAGEWGGTPQGIVAHVRKLEEQLRNKDAEITTLKANQLKPDHVMLPKADADRLAAFDALGKPEELKTKLEAGEKAAQDLAAVQTREAALKFAAAAGIADEAVDTLIAIPALQGAKFEVRKGKVKDAKGQDVDGEIAYLTLPGEGQSALKFEDAKEKVPALKGLAPRTQAKQEQERTFAPQGGGDQQNNNSNSQGGTSTDGDPLAAALASIRKRASAPNALRPAPAQ